MVDCVGIDIDNKNLPDKEEKEFMSLDEYLSVSKKALRYFMSRLRPDLVESVCDDEDVISNVAYAMMIADWKWKEDGGRTRRSFRMNYAWYAVRSYIARRAKYRAKYGKMLSINDSDEDFIFQFIDEKQADPLDIIIGSKYDNEMREINKCLSSELLTPRERYCIREYYFKEKTYKEIGEKIEVTKERVRQLINSSKDKMREYVQNKN
jgi:RNA polymerase sigma factor (sigma-70 family)